MEEDQRVLKKRKKRTNPNPNPNPNPKKHRVRFANLPPTMHIVDCAKTSLKNTTTILHQMVQAGVLVSGLKVFSVKLKENKKTQYADLTQHGLIQYRGQIFQTLSAFTTCMKGRSDNGWTSTFYQGHRMAVHRDRYNNHMVRKVQGFNLTSLNHLIKAAQIDSKPTPKYVQMYKPTPQNVQLYQPALPVKKKVTLEDYTILESTSPIFASSSAAANKNYAQAAVTCLNNVNSVQSVNSVHSVHSVNSVHSLNRVDSPDSVQSANSVNSVQSVNSVNSVDSVVDSVQSVNSLQSVNSVKHLNSVNNVNSVQSAHRVNRVNRVSRANSIMSLQEYEEHMKATNRRLNEMMKFVKEETEVINQKHQSLRKNMAILHGLARNKNVLETIHERLVQEQSN